MFVQFVQQLLTTPRLREGVAWVRRRVAAGEILTNEGVQGCSLFVVERGLLSVTGRVQLADYTTNEVTMAKLTEGNVFGESSLIGDYPSIATVRALTDSDVIEINGAMLSVYLDDNPHEGYLFFKYLLAVALDNLAKANRGIAIEPAVAPMKNGPQRPPI